MDELEQFRSFRAAAAGPGAEAAGRARRAVADVIAREQRRPRARLGSRRVAVAGALAVAAAALAVSLVAPWSGGPGVVERAAAAIGAPPDTVLHLRVAGVSTDLGTGAVVHRGTTELWLAGAAPHRFRGFFDLPFGTSTIEAGGSSASIDALVFHADTDTLDTHRLQMEVPGDQLDGVRAALADGRAVDEGRVELDGREVLRIAVHGLGPEGTDATYYADPQTYAPVETVSDGFLVNGAKRYHVRLVQRFLAYEYLPATPANLKLADIRAMHPDAKTD